MPSRLRPATYLHSIISQKWLESGEVPVQHFWSLFILVHISITCLRCLFLTKHVEELKKTCITSTCFGSTLAHLTLDIFISSILHAYFHCMHPTKQWEDSPKNQNFSINMPSDYSSNDISFLPLFPESHICSQQPTTHQMSRTYGSTFWNTATTFVAVSSTITMFKCHYPPRSPADIFVAVVSRDCEADWRPP